jgi:hypothetical protein
LAVETVTTSKKDNLILNVDGCIAVCFVDLLRNCGAFSPEEAEDYMQMGVLNGLFVLGRSIGLIAHFLDQKRLRTGLYRHPWEVSIPRIIFSSIPVSQVLRISPTFFLSLVNSAEQALLRAEWRSRFKNSYYGRSSTHAFHSISDLSAVLLIFCAFAISVVEFLK